MENDALDDLTRLKIEGALVKKPLQNQNVTNGVTKWE